MEHLSPTTFPAQPFPTEGILYGPHKRWMISLVCRCSREDLAVATLNVWFVIATGTSASFMSKETIRALAGEKNQELRCIDVAVQVSLTTRLVLCPFPVQDPGICNKFWLSTPGSTFENANVLGMDALMQMGSGFEIDGRNKKVILVK